MGRTIDLTSVGGVQRNDTTFFFSRRYSVVLQWLDSNPGAEEEELVDKLKEVEGVANPIIAR